MPGKRTKAGNMESILAELIALLEARNASVWRLGADRCYRPIARSAGAGVLRGAAIPEGSAPAVHRAFAKGDPLIVEEVTAKRTRRFSSVGRIAIKRNDTKAIVAMPIPFEGKWEGLLCVSFRDPRRFNATELGYIRLVARQVGNILDTTRLLEKSQERERAMIAFSEVSALVAGSLELPTVLRRISNNAQRIIDGSHAFVFLADAEGNLIGAAATGKWNRKFAGTRVPVTENSAAGWAFREKRTEIVRDARHDPRISPRLARAFGTRALVATPLIADGGVQGVLVIVDTRTAREFDPEEVRRVETLANYAAIAIEHAAVHAALREREAELRILSERLMNAHESERRRISRELHDVVGQGLAALSLELAAVERQGRPKGGLALGPARRLLRETADAARRLSAELHPGILDDLGLLPAVRWYCGEIARRSGLEVSFEEKTLPRISPEGAVVFYRAVQEGLANVVRHARAKRVSVRFESTPRGVELEIEDDGVGPGRRSKREKRPGVGLIAIRERAAALGGSAALETRARGTLLRVRLPRIPRRG